MGSHQNAARQEVPCRSNLQRKRLSLSAILLASLCLLNLPAQAQAANGKPAKSAAPPTTKADKQKTSANTPPSDTGWKVAAGLGLGSVPRYAGAANNWTIPVPLLDMVYNGRTYIGLNGIAYNFSADKNVQYGIRIAPSAARRQSDDLHLNGMGNIDYIPEAGLFLGTSVVGISVSNGSYGSHAELTSNVSIPLGEDNIFGIGARFQWGDTSYSQTYFGVTAAQAAASGNVLTAYSTSGGFLSTLFTTNWTHNFDKEWFANTTLLYLKLKGDAAQSPLTQRGSMVGLTFMLGYHI